MRTTREKDGIIVRGGYHCRPLAACRSMAV
jgi:hypothetical protein